MCPWRMHTQAGRGGNGENLCTERNVWRQKRQEVQKNFRLALQRIEVWMSGDAPVETGGH